MGGEYHQHNRENPPPDSSLTTCKENDTASKQENDDDNIQAYTQQQVKHHGDDAAALLAMIYLLFISTLLVGALIMGVFVVVQYGLVVFAAVCLAASCLLIVVATVVSIITHDAKLNKARGKIKRWHDTVKEEVLKELNNMREDYVAYTTGMLLLTYDGAEEDEDMQIEDDKSTDDKGQETDQEHSSSIKPKKSHKPKSMFFRAIAPFTKTKKRIWRRKNKVKKSKNDATANDTTYEPPELV